MTNHKSDSTAGAGDFHPLSMSSDTEEKRGLFGFQKPENTNLKRQRGPQQNAGPLQKNAGPRWRFGLVVISPWGPVDYSEYETMAELGKRTCVASRAPGNHSKRRPRSASEALDIKCRLTNSEKSPPDQFLNAHTFREY
jgi:hypothetical protein